MNAKFTDINAAADFHGAGCGGSAVVSDGDHGSGSPAVGVFGQRIKQVPATGHPSRFFEETSIPSHFGLDGICGPAQHCGSAGEPDAGGAECSAEGAGGSDQLQPVRYGAWASSRVSLLICRRKTLPDTVDGVLRTHDRCACGMATDTSLSSPTTATVFWSRPRRLLQVEILFRSVHKCRASLTVSSRRLHRWFRTARIGVRPTAIYANPVLLDLIDREMKAEFNVVLNTKEIAAWPHCEDAFDPGWRYSL